MLAAILLQFSAVICGYFFNLSPIRHHSNEMHTYRNVFSFIAGVGGTISSLTALYLFWVASGFFGIFLYLIVGIASAAIVDKFKGYFPGVFYAAIFSMFIGWIILIF